MATVESTMTSAMTIDGALAVALVDFDSGMTLGSAGTGIDLDIAAAGNTEVIRAKLRTIHALGLNDSIEDVLITLTSQLHLIRLLQSDHGQGLFLYLVLDRERANLAMARRQLLILERELAL